MKHRIRARFSKMDDTHSRRRRGLGVVTPNACTECRKKRAKCDGQVPCGRCSSQANAECIYEVPVRQSKENMRAEIERLRASQQQSNRVLAALISNNVSMNVLDQLRSGMTVDSISKGLDEDLSKAPGQDNNVTTFAHYSDQQAIGSVLHPSRSIGGSPLSTVAFSEPQRSTSIPSNPNERFFAWGSGGSSDNQGQAADPDDKDMMKREPDIGAEQNPPLPYPLIGFQGPYALAEASTASTNQYARDYGQEVILDLKGRKSEFSFNSSSWTTVTEDAELVNHLMALYFCWEYPTFASLSKEHFLDDFKSGRARYCTPLLVNAILALGCRYSADPGARSNPKDKSTAGDHFFAEASRLLQNSDTSHIVTTIQALGLMSLREASCGNSSSGIYLSGQSIRLAIEIGLHQEAQVGIDRASEIEHAVRSATFWGAFALDQAWAMGTGRLPHFSKNLQLVNKPIVVHHVEKSRWIPYTDEGAPLERPCDQPSNVRSVYTSFCELAEIIHRSLYILYTPGQEVDSKSLLSVYTDYLQWYESLTPVLRLGENFTPAVLSAHMHYHFSILLLFRPFIKLEILGSGMAPRDICIQAADAISALVKSYDQLYTLQRTPSFVPYFVLASSITHLFALRNSNSSPEKVRHGLRDLQKLTVGHGFAVRAGDILRFLIRHWDIEGLDTDNAEEFEDTKKMCRPRSQSLNQFCPNISATDNVNSIGPALEGENPIFSPFPLQGRPLINILMLMDAGFTLSENPSPFSTISSLA